MPNTMLIALADPLKDPLSGNPSCGTSYYNYVSIAPSRAHLLALFCMAVSIGLYTDTLRVGSLRYIDKKLTAIAKTPLRIKFSPPRVLLLA